MLMNSSALKLLLGRTGPAPVGELLAGVTDDERAEGALSAIPPDTMLLAAAVSNGLITLSLSEEMSTIQGEKLTQAYAQLVFTATATDGVTRVRFEVAGTPIDVPTSDDANLAVVTRLNYRSLCPTTACTDG